MSWISADEFSGAKKKAAPAPAPATAGTQFTCFTGTKLQKKLTQKALL